MLRPWITDYTGIECPALERRNYYLAPKGVPTEELLKHIHAAATPDDVRFFNHDYQLFQIENAPKQVDGETGRRVGQQRPSPCPSWTTKRKRSPFRTFLRGNPADAEVVVQGLQPDVSGIHRADVYGLENSESVGSRVSLRPHQESGAARPACGTRADCFAFDVGVGKTFTGIATVANSAKRAKPDVQ